MLIILQPFRVGEEIEAGGTSGIVREIQIFSTVMETKDNKTIIVPNAKITSDKIVIHRG
jgi:small conductance mechanosensitive channel